MLLPGPQGLVQKKGQLVAKQIAGLTVVKIKSISILESHHSQLQYAAWHKERGTTSGKLKALL